MTQVELPKIFVHSLPGHIPVGALLGGVAIVVDVLRATTVMAYALAAGCREILPCGEIEEARLTAECVPSGYVLLAGERGGLPIEGFDLGNSPKEFTPELCRDKTIVMTTTNGTRAILASLDAEHVYVAAFVNLEATVRELLVQFFKRDHRPDIHIVCAGSDGHVSLEDNLLAGSLAKRLAEESYELAPSGDHDPHDLDYESYERQLLSHKRSDWADNEAATAVSEWRAVERSLAKYPLSRVLAGGLGGRNLERLGLTADIEACSKVDVLDVVGKLGRKPTRISKV